jgi:hypothetical protein
VTGWGQTGNALNVTFLTPEEKQLVCYKGLPEVSPICLLFFGTYDRRFVKVKWYVLIDLIAIMSFKKNLFAILVIMCFAPLSYLHAGTKCPSTDGHGCNGGLTS